ncbi:MAG: hypothetical protein HYR84_14190 [Planctomycetes bacterium]|nr:hypothetical protein [Planctomycetota bacterium]
MTTEPNTPISQQNLRAVGDAYGEMVREKNRPPANLEELKPYLKKRGDPDALIKSENDGEPFVIYFGVNISATGKEVPVIAHEKSGRGGKRLVLQGSTVRHMTEEEFQAAPFPPGKKAP